MLNFASDYLEGAHPNILEALIRSNFVSCPGYGDDVYCKSAKEKIRKAIGRDDVDVWFLVGGTQTNRIVINSALAIYEGVISADTGHIYTHECGAIEHSGHKVISLPQSEGKLSAETVRDYLETFYADQNHEASVFPGMVYISHPTELGTLYTKTELTALSEVCHEYNLPLFMDGARLGYGLVSPASDLTLREISELVDVFYIGGTKVGALCGEAVVFTKGNTPKHFYSTIKQNGALLAIGRLLGVQFDALFTDDLYFEISKNAIRQAQRLIAIFEKKGYPFFLKTDTNQQFVILENEKMEALSKQVIFSYWEKYDEGHTVVRFCTSWATTDAQMDALERIL